MTMTRQQLLLQAGAMLGQQHGAAATQQQEGACLPLLNSNSSSVDRSREARMGHCWVLVVLAQSGKEALVDPLLLLLLEAAAA